MKNDRAFRLYAGELCFDAAHAAETALSAAKGGIVLLENNGALPFRAGEPAAFFGRMQKDYRAMGTGSGGLVNAISEGNIFDELRALGLSLDGETEAFYDAYVAEHPYDVGNGWYHPNSQTEPEIPAELLAGAASRCGTALYVITRMTGESGDLAPGRGGFMATETELRNLRALRAAFGKVVIIFNTVGIMDFSELREFADAMLLCWNGGMTGARAAAEVLLGLECPSGRLPDTVARTREAYPTAKNWGDPDRCVYEEDIFVGYRYFETFAKEQVLYPFGYGLSYTEFALCCTGIRREEGAFVLSYRAENRGFVPGREVAELYLEAPQGRLGKPARVLAGFDKTPLIRPGESFSGEIRAELKYLSSYDEAACRYLLERGEYRFFLGENVRDAAWCAGFALAEDLVLRETGSALAPSLPFRRMVNRGGELAFEDVPLRREAPEPGMAPLPPRPLDGAVLADAADGKISMEDFVAGLSDEALATLCIGEGMSSPKVTPGTGGCFGGVTQELLSLGIPAVACTDGPSGVRLESEVRTVLYPSASCLAAGWDRDAARACYRCCGDELASLRVDMLLGPGINLHRDPCCGRNFEYLSEDPLLAGLMGAAICAGLDDAGVSGVIKHCFCNHQELERKTNESVLSERAARELYGRPFEICIAESPVRGLMTSYNRVNGRWSASNYDLTERLLRRDYGFTGLVMTDWWAFLNSSDPDERYSGHEFSAMVHARNDLYMVSDDAQRRVTDLREKLAAGGDAAAALRGELQRCALDILSYVIGTLSFRAWRSGWQTRDLAAECEGRAPFFVCPVTDGKAAVTVPAAGRFILRVTLRSDTDPLIQTGLSLNVRRHRAADFTVGGTGGGTVTAWRELSLAKGENLFEFTSAANAAGSAPVSAVEIALF